MSSVLKKADKLNLSLSLSLGDSYEILDDKFSSQLQSQMAEVSLVKLFSDAC